MCNVSQTPFPCEKANRFSGDKSNEPQKAYHLNKIISILGVHYMGQNLKFGDTTSQLHHAFRFRIFALASNLALKLDHAGCCLARCTRRML